MEVRGKSTSGYVSFFCLFGARFLNGVLERYVLIRGSIRYFVTRRDFKDVPRSFMLSNFAPEILCRVMFITFLIFNCAMGRRAIIIDDFPIIMYRLTLFLYTPLLQLELTIRFLFFKFRFRPIYRIQATRFLRLFYVKRCNCAITYRTLFTCIAAPYGNMALVSDIIGRFRRLIGERIMKEDPAPIILCFRSRQLMRKVINVKDR